ncbi:hypothetical protein BP5796_05013 [Coleophoma crateriformis]|uniref:Phenylacetaldoxime dehydratase n=1 Tax=Coleophoma crateriformis TaxID=565419 RepID=A0A3D8SAX0_9HELO|nr:hypothetical protein BP5796_05013 [Coleophoma crateriformis]
MWGVNLDPDVPMVYSIFGVQYLGEIPNTQQQTLIDTFTKLIDSSAKHVDHVIQQDPLAQTRIWLAYWSSPASYRAWWLAAETVQFWDSLPPDAGMWREILNVPRRRTQFGTNKQENNGLAHVGTLTPNTTKSGYWGCYRDRIEAATPTDRLDTPLSRNPTPQLSSTTVRLGRVRMNKLPDNLCFVVEGQDHSGITVTEKDHWFENFDETVTKWITDIVAAGAEAGVLTSRLCFAPESGKFRDLDPTPLNYNRKIQLFYFLDFGHMERIGRHNKGHVGLRSSFMQSYCPIGPMGKLGQLLLWAETSILKSEDIECEYVGCLVGTGLMAYDHHPAFGTAKDKQILPTISWLKSWFVSS